MEKVGLLGFGKIGQSIASVILERGKRVIAVDTGPGVSTMLETSTYENSEPGVAPSIRNAYQKGSLSVHSDYRYLADCNTIVVCIPLLLISNGEERMQTASRIDYFPFDEAMRKLSSIVQDVCLISIETTVPVGTCRNRVVSTFAKAGKAHGRDYLLSYSPERIMSNTMREQLLTTPKIVSGLDNQALEAALSFYKTFIPAHLVKSVSSLEVAEMIKLSAMVSRDINLAVINQLALFCDSANIDIREVLGLVNTDNFSNLLNPGIGVGGHCTPIYPHFLIENFAKHDMRFALAEEARKINDGMAEFLISEICREHALSSALILGLGFRPNVKEDASSPAYAVRKVLQKHGVRSSLHDPLFSAAEIEERGFNFAKEPYDSTIKYDLLVLVTAHDQYAELDYVKIAKAGCKVVLDGRNILDEKQILELGMVYRGVGTGANYGLKVHSSLDQN